MYRSIIGFKIQIWLKNIYIKSNFVNIRALLATQYSQFFEGRESRWPKFELKLKSNQKSWTVDSFTRWFCVMFLYYSWPPWINCLTLMCSKNTQRNKKNAAGANRHLVEHQKKSLLCISELSSAMIHPLGKYLLQ